MASTALYWFSHDLRVDDNPTFFHALKNSRALCCVAFLDPHTEQPNRYGLRSTGPLRQQFLIDCFSDLNDSLLALGLRLLVLNQPPLDAIPELIMRLNIDAVYRSQAIGFYEQRDWKWLQDHYSRLTFVAKNGHCLFDEQQLPFTLGSLPSTFSAFRKKVESLPIIEPINHDAERGRLPKQIDIRSQHQLTLVPLKTTMRSRADNNTLTEFIGGTQHAVTLIDHYFLNRHASSYKDTRNALSGWDNSSKWSAWLAHGCISARQLIAKLQQYESNVSRNESTYWLYVELLWRDYFQWYALAHRTSLFGFAGVVGRKPLTTFYPGRFKAWCEGQTPYPLVNACMRELNATGYMSNRGRQIVASCLVNELGLDWRYGAAYFEQQLIDYDVANNWGNWQYIAGVGADPRGGRHFNIDKQQQQYDPDGEFIATWASNDKQLSLDTTDAADWPL